MERSLEAERHPSHQMLDRVEHTIYDRESAERYLEELLDLVASQRYPSHRMLARIERVLTLLALADAESEAEDG
ncbi:hypothetical protein [Egicoccus halophilus]|uniref:Uncharacterized protein n=1 Tax=Egicoccus halophilus TaxID=1670830 RepID=A0A8J3ESP0_9ACTN|nr:hypothetical protein [Egicoccus halophilus]GGI03835.1 hypothetical protein GCM10011354_06030 [Egicoccus halophilus]